MLIAQTEVITETVKTIPLDNLTSSHLFWLLIFVIFSLFWGWIAFQAKPLLEKWSEHKQQELDKKLAFDHEQLKQKFEKDNKLATSLEMNAQSLERATRILDDVTKKCISHQKLMHNAIDDADSLSEQDSDRLHKVVEARE